MNIRLPFFVDNQMEADVSQLGDSLTLRIGNYQKGVILPVFLAGMRVKGARYEEGWLAIDFIRKETL